MRRFTRLALGSAVLGLALSSFAVLGVWRGSPPPASAQVAQQDLAEPGLSPIVVVGTGRVLSGPNQSQSPARLFVSVYGLSVTGTLSPAGAPFSFELLDISGTLKAQRTGTLGANGELAVQLTTQDRRGVPILPGDYLRLVPQGGVTTTLSVPPMTARADNATRSVIGTAPPGAHLDVAMTARHGCDIGRGGGTPGGPPGDTRPLVTVPATADANGNFSATFPGNGVWENGTSGQMTYVAPEGHTFTASWASIRLRMTSQQDFLDLVVPPGRVISVTTFAADGRPVATGLEQIGAKVGNWSCWTVAQLTPMRELGTAQRGEIVIPMPTDRIRLDVGETTFEVKVPELVGHVDVATGRVFGLAAPRADVVLEPQRPGGGGPMGGPQPLGPAVTVKADASGRFSHTFTAGLLSPADQVSMEAWIDNSRFTHFAHDGALTINLNARTVSGRTAPFAGIYGSVRRGETVVRSLTGRAGARGDFALDFAAGASEPFAFQAGDRLQVQVGSAAGPLDYHLTLPELDLVLDATSGEAKGRASVGGRVELTAQMLPNVSTSGVTPRTVTPEADGSYRATLGLSPGTRVDAIYALPGGHRVILTRVVPVVHVQHGGSQVCGWANPGDPVVVQLVDSRGRALASASAVAGGGSGLPVRDDARIAFIAELRDADEKLAVARPEARVSVTIDSQVITGTVPQLFPDLDWSKGPGTGTIEGSFGSTEAGAKVFATGPSTNCFGRDDGTPSRDGNPGSIKPAPGPANPAFYRPINAPNGVFADTFQFGDPGTGFLLAVALPSGVRFTKPFLRPLSQAVINTPTVRGFSSPRERVEAQLLDANFNGRAWASEMVTDDGGQFELTLRTLDGKPATMLEGDVVELAATRRLEQSPLRDLTFRATADGRFTGTAPAGQPLTLRLHLRDGRWAPLRVYADRDGRVQFGPESAPGRVAWRYQDILGITAILGTDPKHEVVADALAADLPDVPPPPPILLPAVRR